MEEHPEVMTSTNLEGVKRVESENYAFLMESTSIEYETERRCKLAQIGHRLDDKDYGIALKKGVLSCVFEYITLFTVSNQNSCPSLKSYYVLLILMLKSPDYP